MLLIGFGIEQDQGRAQTHEVISILIDFGLSETSKDHR
jgi:hypothetical protein